VIGHIGCLQDEMLGLIASHVVVPDYRGFGVGGRLLAELVVLARNEGLRLVEALLRPTLPRVCRLYEHHLFREAGAAPADGWARYERRLDGPT
jgi:GNAT superfamily N-acetyltransferase